MSRACIYNRFVECIDCDLCKRNDEDSYYYDDLDLTKIDNEKVFVYRVKRDDKE